MDYLRILRRSFEITWLYRALWIFGIILALTAPNSGGGNGGGGGGGGGSSFIGHPGFAGQGLPQLFDPSTAAMLAFVITIALLLGVIFTVARVVSETALIRMVNDYADSGVKMSMGQGFRLGWSRSALRIFLIDLLAVLGVMIVFLLVFGIAAAPLAGLLSESDAVKTVGMAGGVFLLLLAFALFIGAIIVLSVLIPFIHRACVLEGQGVIASFRRGWAVFRSRTTDALLMTLALFCVGLALSLVIIPVVLLLLFGGAAIASLPGLLAGLIASLFVQGELPLVIGLAVGIPILMLVIMIPLLFVGGLGQVFTSSTWTLTYREILSLTAPRAETPAAL
jgi:hypothetical protein